MLPQLRALTTVPFLWSVLGVQQARQASAPANPSSAAANAAPTQWVPASILQDGTPIKLQLVNKLDSRTARDGDEIQFDVVNDVVLSGVIVLRRGSIATGVVTQASASKTMGRAGRLSFTINAIQLLDGSKVPVRAFNRTSGENRTGEMVGMMLEMPIVSAPFFLLMHGTNTSFPRGTEITAFVNGDLHLNAGGVGDTPSDGGRK
jgi:hypothetical protein